MRRIFNLIIFLVLLATAGFGYYVTRPLPFTALPRPALADLAKDLLRKRETEE